MFNFTLRPLVFLLLTSPVSMLEISFKKRAPRAVRVVRQFAAKMMLTTDVPRKKIGACFHLVHQIDGQFLVILEFHFGIDFCRQRSLDVKCETESCFRIPLLYFFVA